MGILNSKPKTSGDDGAKPMPQCRYLFLPGGTNPDRQQLETPKQTKAPKKNNPDSLSDPFNPQVFR